MLRILHLIRGTKPSSETQSRQAGVRVQSTVRPTVGSFNEWADNLHRECKSSLLPGQPKK